MSQQPTQPLPVAPDVTIRGAMERMNEAHRGLLPVVNSDGTLYGVLADGDIRRALVAGASLDGPVAEICNRKPVTALADAGHQELVHLMRLHHKQCVPVLDEAGRYRRIEYLEEISDHPALPNPVVLLAGGFGKRLRPYTDKIPKPMLRVGGKPLIEAIVEGLAEHGLNHIIALLHYKPEVFTEYFQGRTYWGREIEFEHEKEPRGTAGGLSLLRGRLDRTFLVMNGDNIIRAPWPQVIEHHERTKNIITIGATTYSAAIPFGVLQVDEGRVTGITEKPVYNWHTVCSAYCASPEALDYIPDAGPFDMPDLINAALADGRRVGYFPVAEYQRMEDLVPSHENFWE
jgi:dTDP-glucose pyrophosphorylase